MKKISPIVLVLLIVSSVLAHEQNTAITLAPDSSDSNQFVGDQRLTDADDGATITLRLGDKLSVDLPNERHYESGDEQYGVESVSTVYFDGSSTEGVLNEITSDLGDGSLSPHSRTFLAAAVGCTTLSYERRTSYVGHGGCATPLCTRIESISFNIVVNPDFS